MADLTDGGWGKDSENNPQLPDPSVDNNPGRQDNKPPSSRFAGPSSQPKFGFEAFMNHRLNSSGGQLMGRQGKGAAYDGGDFHGQTPGQAQESLRAEYDAMPDSQRQNWENTAQGNDVRSSRELGQVGSNPSPTGSMPLAPTPPYTASGANPLPAGTPPVQNASAAVAGTPAAPAGRIGAVTGDTPVPAAQQATAPSPSAFAANIQGTPPPNPALPISQPGGAIRAFAGAENDTDRFGPKMSGGGDQPVVSSTTPNASLVPSGGIASSLPSDDGNKGPVAMPAPMPSSGAGTAPSDPSNFAGPSGKPPAMAGAAGDDIAPTTGKKRA